MDKKAIALLEEQKVYIENITEMLYQSLGSFRGLDPDQVRLKLNPIFQSSLERSRDEARRISETGTDVEVRGFLHKQIRTNQALLVSVVELQLRILSAQTGESVLSLRNRLVDQS